MAIVSAYILFHNLQLELLSLQPFDNFLMYFFGFVINCH